MDFDTVLVLQDLRNGLFTYNDPLAAASNDMLEALNAGHAFEPCNERH